MGEKIKIHCSHTELRDPTSLVEHPRNYNTHPAEQIRLLAKIIKHQGWRNPITVSKRSGFVVKGHGRLAAAMILKTEKVPVDVQDYKDEASEVADMIADNRIAELAEADQDALKDLLVDDLFEDFDLEVTGYDPKMLIDWDNEENTSDSENYSRKIEAPIYEPKEKKQPQINELYDLQKQAELTEKIDKSKAPEDLKDFLKAAATRHCVFKYDRIAEYYSHADPETQDLMEQSALVIIDFDKAIENGFVKLSEEIAIQYKKDHG